MLLIRELNPPTHPPIHPPIHPRTNLGPVGKKVAAGWQSTVEATKTGIAAVTDEEAAKKVGDTTKRWWGAVADTTTGILSDLAAPDEDEPAFPRPGTLLKPPTLQSHYTSQVLLQISNLTVFL